jgi:hypothetical protein
MLWILVDSFKVYGMIQDEGFLLHDGAQKIKAMH